MAPLGAGRLRVKVTGAPPSRFGCTGGGGEVTLMRPALAALAVGADRWLALALGADREAADALGMATFRT